MAATLKIQAREIVRWAKRNKFTLERGRTGMYDIGCVLAAIATAKIGKREKKKWNVGEIRCGDIVGLSHKQAKSLEAGFEGWTQELWEDKRYYKMGKRVAELAGL